MTQDPLDAITRLIESVQLPYALIGGHAVNTWLEPRFTADVDLTVAAESAGLARPKDRIDLEGLCALGGLDWDYVERWAREWDVLDRLARYHPLARK